MSRIVILYTILGVFASGIGPASAQGPDMPYRDSSLRVEDRVKDLISRMTLEEKFWQLFMIPGSLDDSSHDYSKGVFGLQISADTLLPPHEAARAHAERVNSIQRYFVEQTRLGIPIIPFDEALHGLMREGALVFPQAIGMAATWDSTLMARASQAVARESRHRGIRQVLSPVVNIANDVRWGRVEETFGEDVHLTGVMGRAFVREFERAGIVTTPKHFVANVGEGGRDSYPIDISKRMLKERFFPPFSTLIGEGSRSVMTAYNSVDGLPATQSGSLLNGTLKRDWNFSGYVISDAAATGGATVLHLTEASTATATKRAFEAGLDVVFQSEYPQHRPYLEAFRRGLIPDSVIDAALTRVLRAKFELGLFENPYVNTDSAAYWNGHARHRALAREAARKSIVLLRNSNRQLPIGKSNKSIAVIGTDAAEARLGGYSGRGILPVTILDGINNAVSSQGTRVVYAPGPGRSSRSYTVIPAEFLSHEVESADRGSVRQAGLSAEYFANNSFEGDAHTLRVDRTVDFGWTLSSPARGIPYDWYSVRWLGNVTAPLEGVRTIGVEANDGYRLWIDDELVIDNWEKRSFGARYVRVNFAPGSVHSVRLEYFESTGNARVRLVWDAGMPSDRDRLSAIDSAAAIARDADAAIIVVGVEEGEFRDRAVLSLPGLQEELIRSVAATGTPVTVVVIAGSAVTMSNWIDSVASVLYAWYPGEEGGNAVADILFGDYSPAGRLPITFPLAEGQLPLTYDHKPTGRGDDYIDLTGHPLFPFGYGLSYTEFNYSDLRIVADTSASERYATVTARVTNIGNVEGDEVVQLYTRDILATVARPVMQLQGFARVYLKPGESTDVTFSLTAEHLRMLNENMEWVVEPGVFRVMIGASSRDIRLRGEFTVNE